MNNKLDEMMQELHNKHAELGETIRLLSKSIRIKNVWGGAFTGGRSVYVDARYGNMAIVGRGLPTRAKIVVSNDTGKIYELTAEQYLYIEEGKYTDRQQQLIIKYWENK